MSKANVADLKAIEITLLKLTNIPFAVTEQPESGYVAKATLDKKAYNASKNGAQSMVFSAMQRRDVFGELRGTPNEKETSHTLTLTHVSPRHLEEFDQKWKSFAVKIRIAPSHSSPVEPEPNEALAPEEIYKESRNLLARRLGLSLENLDFCGKEPGEPSPYLTFTVKDRMKRTFASLVEEKVLTLLQNNADSGMVTVSIDKPEALHTYSRQKAYSGAYL